MTKLIHLNNVKREENTVLTVGTFDGVHAGHQVLMNTVLKKARQRNARSMIITFDPHPREILTPGASGIRLLSTLQERRLVLEKIGIDVLLVIPFDRDFSLLSAEEFIRNIIYKRIGVREFVIGYDHHFGRDRRGTIETVERLGKELGFDAYVVSKQEVGNDAVSSTAIRGAIAEKGNMKKAAQMLQRPYQISGTVVHGNKRGHKIGFPTANIQPADARKIIPKNGVYVVKVSVDDKNWGGMMNIGTRPTFDEAEPTLEVHCFNFDEDVYGKNMTVSFIKRIRDEQQFDGVTALKTQLEHDKTEAQRILQEA